MKYLVIWEFHRDNSLDSQRLGKEITSLFATTKDFLRRRIVKDWGVFVGQTKGYAVIEASDEEAAEIVKKYVSHVDYTSYRIASVDQVDETVGYLLKSFVVC